MTPPELRTRILDRIAEWSAADLARLDALLALGAPSEMHAGAPDAPGDHAIGPGGVVETWRTGAADRVRADVLHAWRGVSQACGQALPAPGKV